MIEKPEGRYLGVVTPDDKKILSPDANGKLVLNVEKMKIHYEKDLAYRETMRDFFVNEGLLVDPTQIQNMAADKIVIRYKDFTDEGWWFLKSLAVEKWLGSCDRKGTLEAYRNYDGLKKRFLKFRASEAAKANH